MHISRRQFLGLTAAAIPGSMAYAYGIERTWLEVNQKDLVIPGLPQPVGILHLSDFHLSSVIPLRLIEEAIDQGLALKPDLICVTGDFITHDLKEPENYRAVLNKLAGAAPAFAVLGNHDGGLWAASRGHIPTTGPMLEFLGGAGLRILHNRSERLCVGTSNLLMMGLGDLWSGECELNGPPPDTADPAPHARILLAHNPDTKDALKPFAWHLMLSGHTHGGQLRIPFIGAPLAPVRDKRYTDGLRPWNNRWIHVSRGVGCIAGLRINCRPEVTLLRLCPPA